MAVKLIGDKIAVEVLEQEEVKVGSIFLMPTSTDDLTKGKVVAVGTGGFSFNGDRLALDVQVGDVVLFATFRGTNVRDTDGTQVKVLEEKDVVAILA